MIVDEQLKKFAQQEQHQENASDKHNEGGASSDYFLILKNMMIMIDDHKEEKIIMRITLVMFIMLNMALRIMQGSRDTNNRSTGPIPRGS